MGMRSPPDRAQEGPACQGVQAHRDYSSCEGIDRERQGRREEEGHLRFFFVVRQVDAMEKD
uniref:Uncharacterized protein n=1 Tax=Oryza nivara TaxID=4536 RepID=A0A0E0FVQ9_ORYNI